MAASLVIAPAAHAEILLSADFQDGKTTGWSATGGGDIRLTAYGKNISLKIMGGAAAITRFSTRHYHDIAVSSAFAAEGHGREGACVAEVSIDRGSSWIEVWRTNPGMEDGVTLHRGGGTLQALGDADAVVLRLKNTGAGGSVCWADDIVITGTAIPDDSPARTALRAPSLSGRHEPGPWPMAAFSPASPASPAAAHASTLPPPASAHADGEGTRNRFEGGLKLEAPGEQGFTVLTDRYGDAAANKAAATRLPDFDFEFLQSGDALIPLRRGTIPGNHPAWEFILEPGKVWDEAADGDYTRAALPFTLEERNANCMHNGVLTFLFRADGSVSDVAFEIAQETCAYFQFNWWGYARASYAPHPVPGRDELAARYADEVRLRLPLRPLAALAADFPGANPERFASALELPPQSLTTHGLLVDGIHYGGECSTRFGAYPFCEVLDLPSYSLSKSMVGAIATMRLAVAYPKLPEALISDWVPPCAAKGTWSGVTVKNTLDMATGHYLSAADQHDEDGPDMLSFFLAEGHAAKLSFACTHYPRREKPGERWVYHTADTYVLGSALNAFYRSVAGAGADFYRDVLAKDVWHALHLSPVLDVPRRTYDAAAQPWTGYGLTLHRDDIAKIGAFLLAAPPPGAAPLLDPALLRAALQRDPADPGLKAGADDLRYNHGFWAWNAQRALGCSRPTWIPFMSGYGGIVVALLPNGMIYYYISDGGVFRWALAAAEADRIRPFCDK